MNERSDAIASWLDKQPSLPGLLSGLRIGVKELIAVAGVGCSANSHVFLPRDWTRPDIENSFVTALRRAGASITCTTTTHEFAWGITTREGIRTVVNPLDRRCVAGGSSGGAAVAVSLGLVDVALGTDTAGSIRIPAAWCGMLGWKPSHGVLPTDHVIPLAPSFDCVGIIAPGCESLLRVLAIAGVTPQPTSRRIGLVGSSLADSGSRTAVMEAATMLERCGYVIEPARTPDLREMYEVFATVQLVEALRVHTQILATWPHQSEHYGPGVRRRLELAETIGPVRAREARERVAHFRRELRALTADTTLLMPATGCPPPKISEPNMCDIDGERMRTRDVVLPHTVPASLAGLPAGAVPWPVDERTTGVQVVGAYQADGELLRVVEALASGGWSSSV